MTKGLYFSLTGNRYRNVTLLLLFVLLGLTKSWATAYTWGSTTTGGPWVTPGNWTGAVAPSSGAANTVAFNPSSSITINNTAPTTSPGANPFLLSTFTAGTSNTGTTVLAFSTSITYTITTLNLTTGNLTLGGGGQPVNMTVSGGTIAASKTLTIGSGCNLTIAAGTFTVNGSISNSGTITVNSGATLLFTGSSFPSGITVNSGGTLALSGSLITGGSATINGTMNLGNGTGAGSTATGFLCSWGAGSTLIYQGNTAQTATFRELPTSNGPTNVTINNTSGVTLDATFGCSPVITGTLTLTNGVLDMNTSGFNTITLEDGNTPLARTNGTLKVNLHNELIFGATGHLAGNAFIIPTGIFNNPTTLGGITVNRTNSLQLPANALTLTGITTPDALKLVAGAVILTSSGLTINGKVSTTTGGTLTGTASTPLTITGVDDIGGALSFTSGGQLLSTLTVTRTNSSGTGMFRLGSALSVTTLTMNNGQINNGANVLTVTGTLTTSVTGGSAATNAWVDGPLAITLPSGLAAGSTYRLPVGLSTYNEFALVNPTTTGGTVVVQAQAFDANSLGSGSAGFTHSGTAPRYWSASKSGAGTLSSAGQLRLMDAAMTYSATSAIGNSSTKTGSYTSLGGTNFNSPATGNISTGTTVPVALGFFEIGTLNCTNPMSGTVYVGTGAGTPQYTNFSALFGDINARGLSANLSVVVQQTAITEPAAANPLNSIVSCSGGPFNVTVTPATATTYTISTATTTTTPVITLNGADNITFDGRPGSTGSTGYLTFASQNVAATACAILFQNDAQHNTLEYCTFTGRSNSTGVVQFLAAATGGTGNSFNLVDHNTIASNSAGSLAAGFYSTNPTASTVNSDNTVSNNNIADALLSSIYVSPTGSGSNWTISGNSVYNTATNTNNQSYIDFEPGAASISDNITGNFLGGSAAGATGTGNFTTAANESDGIYVNAGSDAAHPCVISGNTITNYTSSAGKFVGISILGSTSATVSGNTVGSGTTAGVINLNASSGANWLYGIETQSTGTVTITGNTVGGLFANSSANQEFGIYQSTGIASIKNNTVINVYNAASTAAATSAAIGIAAITTGSGNDISGNTVRRIGNSSVSTLNSNQANGIVVSSNSGNTGNLYNNKCTEFFHAGNNGGISYGIQIQGAGSWNVYNNMVNMHNMSFVPAVYTTRKKVIGIYDNTSAGTNNYYYNSVLIQGDAAVNGAGTTDYHSYCFLKLPSSGSGATVTVKDNVLINNFKTMSESTTWSQNYAIGTTTSTGFTSDYNFLSTQEITGFPVGKYNGTDAMTLANWRTTSGQDANSFIGAGTGITALPTSGNPSTPTGNTTNGTVNPYDLFVNAQTGDLHVTITPSTSPVYNPFNYLVAKGIAAGSITSVDYDGTSRNSPPNTGAHEFVANPSLTISGSGTGASYADGTTTQTLNASITATSGTFPGKNNTGWTATGSITSGTNTSGTNAGSVTFNITQNTSITWIFANDDIPALTAKEAGVAGTVTECSGAALVLTSNPVAPTPNNCGGVFQYAWYNGTAYWDGSAFTLGSPSFSAAYQDINVPGGVSTNTTFTVTTTCSSNLPSTGTSSVTVNVLSASPGVPTAVIGSPANGVNHHMTANWTAAAGSTGYDLDRSTDGTTWTNVFTNSNVITKDDATGDDPNTSIYYRVRNHTAGANCTYSVISAPVYTACDVPAAPTLTGATPSTLNVAITAESPVANPAITTYSIFCTTNGQFVQPGGTFGATEVFQTAAAWATTTVGGLTNNTSYCFYAKAKNNDGNVVSGSANTACATTCTLPIVSITPTTPAVCIGSSITLTANCSGNCSGISYTWSTGGTGTTIAPSPSSNTTYSVTGTLSGACSNNASKLVTVNALPVVSVNPQVVTMCTASSVSLTASGANTYAWAQTAGAGLSAISGNPVSVSPASNGSYTVTATGTDGNGCSGTATVAITAATPSAPLSGTVTVGTAGTYPSFNGASGLFAAINTHGLSGNLTAQVISDITETSSTPLNGIVSCGGPYTLTIQPNNTTLRTISGNVTPGLIIFNGAANVIVDGRSGGSGQYLKFAVNNSTSSDFIFQNNANNITIKYSLLDIQSTSNTGSLVNFSTCASAGMGNSYITIDHNTIGSTNWAANGIISSGTGGTPNHNDTITNNSIYNFQYPGGGTTTRSSGINITATGNGSNWTISGNSLYSTAVNSQNVQTAIDFSAGSSSNNNIISGNFIGGSAAQNGTCTNGCGVNYMGNSYQPTATEVQHIGINVNAGTGTFVTGNTVKRIWISDPYYSGYIGVNIGGSTTVTVNNNLFGGTFPADFLANPTSADMIEVDAGAGSTYPGYIYGIWSQTSGTFTADNNTFNYMIQEGVTEGGNVQCIVHQGAGTAIITNNDNTQYHQEAYGIDWNSYGIRIAPTASTSGNRIENNKIGAVMVTGASINQVSTDGIMVDILPGLTVSGTIKNNQIFDNSSVENSGVIEGIYINTSNGNSSSNGNWDIYNNMIYLSNVGQTTIRTEIDGIDVNLNSASTTNIYYNTVWISGTNRNNTSTLANPSSALLIIPGASGASGTMTVKNNALINNRQGGSPNSDTYHTALWHSSASTTGWSSDYNLYYTKYVSPSSFQYGRMAVWGTNSMFNLATLQGFDGADAHSYRPNTDFTGTTSNFAANNVNLANLFNQSTSTADLTVNVNDGESYKFLSNRGTPISITTDLGGDTRDATTPDLGADEFLPCNNPVVSGNTTSGPTTCSGSNGSITLNGLLNNTTYGVTYNKNGTPVSTANYTSNGSGNLVIGSLTAGNYDNFVLTINVCTSTAYPATGFITLSDPPLPVIASHTPTGPTTCSGSNGNIKLNGLNVSTTYSVNYKKNGTLVGAANFTSDASGIITVGGLTAGSYDNFTVTINNCTSAAYPASSSISLSDPALPVISSNTPTSPSTCSGSNGNILLNGLNNSAIYSVNYNKNGASVGAANFTSSGAGVITVGGLTAGTYDNFVVTLNSTGCTSAAAYPSSGTITLTDPALPVISSNTPTSPSTCSGSNGSILLNGLNNSAIYSVNYNKNGTSVGAANFTSSGAGVITIGSLTAGSYDNFIVTLNSTGCTSAAAYPSSGTITLTDPALPVISSNTPTSPSTCSGSNGSILLNGLNNNAIYSVNYNKNGAAVGAANFTSSGAGVITVGGLTAGTYDNFVVTLNSTGCTSAAAYPSSGTITLTDPALPVISSNTPTSPSTCSGSNGSILLNGLNNSAIYSVNYNKNGNPVGAANFTSSGAGVITIGSLTAGSYDNFLVTLNSTGCTSAAYPSSGSISLSDPALPVISSNTPTGPTTCSGSNGNIKLNGLNNSAIYSVNYNKNGTAVGAANFTSSASGVITIGSLTAGAYDNFVVTLNSTGCASAAYPSSGNITLSDPPTPTIFTVTGGVCVPVTVGLSGSQNGANFRYQLVRDGVTNVDTPIVGTGNPFSFPQQFVTGTYGVVATNTTTSCSSIMDGVFTVGICGSTWTGDSSTNWFENDNWNPKAVPNVCAANVIIPFNVAHFPVISGASVNIGDVTIAAGATLTLQGQNLTVCGNWTGGTGSNATVSGSGTVFLSGSSAQTIDGNTKFEILQIKNGLGVSIKTGGNVSINTGLHLEHGDLDARAGTLRLLSTAHNHGSYIDDFYPGVAGVGRFDGRVIGNIKADRFMPVAGYNQHFISSPVNSPDLSQINASGDNGQYVIPTNDCDETISAYGSPYGNVFVYNDGHAANDKCMLGNWMVKSQGAMDNGRGYSAYQTGNTIRTLTGDANTGNLSVGGLNNSGYDSVPTKQGQSIEAGWNLVGNPYPSSIDMTQSRLAQGFQSQVQIWQTTGAFAGSWQPVVINGTQGQVVIPAFQGVMVRRVGAGSGSYPFYQTERKRSGSINFYRTAAENGLALELDYNGAKDLTKVEFNPSATAKFDDEYDANKYDGSAGRPTLYTTTGNSTQWYAVNTLPSLAQTTTIPMGLRPEANGTMVLTPTGIESFDPTTYILLEDKKTNTWHNLRDGAYTFTTEKTDLQDRFVLHFTPAAQILTSDANCDMPGMINIAQPGSANWNYTVTDNNNVAISSGILNQSSPVSVSVNTGSYTLVLSDNAGYKVVKNILVGGLQAVTAVFTPSTTNAQVQESITFNSNSGAVTSTWQFGDGATATGSNVSHSYLNEGIYNVTLTVTNTQGCTSTTTRSITITEGAATGITNLTDNNAIKIWSHDNMLYVGFSQQPRVDAEIEIYNVIGQLINHEKFGGSTLYTKQIDNTEAAYMIIKVISDNQLVTKRVFISNVNK